MKKRFVLITFVLLGVSPLFFLKKGKADSGGVPAQIARLQATVDAIKDSVIHIDPTIIGDTTLTTGMLFSGGSDRFACNVVNASETEVTVSISFVLGSGRVLQNSILTISPHWADGIIAEKLLGFGYCRFNFSGAPNAIRANGALQEGLDGVGSYKVVIEAR
jgi:hypothetical protein